MSSQQQILAYLSLPPPHCPIHHPTKASCSFHRGKTSQPIPTLQYVIRSGLRFPISTIRSVSSNNTAICTDPTRAQFHTSTYWLVPIGFLSPRSRALSLNHAAPHTRLSIFYTHRPRSISQQNRNIAAIALTHSSSHRHSSNTESNSSTKPDFDSNFHSATPTPFSQKTRFRTRFK